MAPPRSQSARLGLLLFLAVAVIIAIGTLLLWPKFQQMREERVNLQKTESEHDQKKRTVEGIEKLVRNFKSKAEQLAIVEQTLPSAPEVPQLLASLEQLALQSGMSVMGILVTDPTLADARFRPKQATSDNQLGAIPKPELVELKIDLSLSGDYGNFANLLDALERNQRLFEVSSITAEPNSGAQESGAVFTLVIKTSYQK
ncbi:MAG: type 4a pilus biogenesis protein PilO [Candidatus Doudnabacteria bacterium]|nr:type 4a pilus biogenesis protein PilO [Candidatus Doudnabacteria bacterium]